MLVLYFRSKVQGSGCLTSAAEQAADGSLCVSVCRVEFQEKQGSSEEAPEQMQLA